MSNRHETITGGCLCGAVRYEAHGEPREVCYCHCHSCRRHTGAPVVALVFFDADNVRFTGRDRSIYNSSPGVGRGFCGQCGTSLTYEGKFGDRAVRPSALALPPKAAAFDGLDSCPEHSIGTGQQAYSDGRNA